MPLNLAERVEVPPRFREACLVCNFKDEAQLTGIIRIPEYQAQWNVHAIRS